MAAERMTIGKVTYIHGAQRLSSPIDLDAGLDDPALQRQPKPIPVIAIGDELAQPKPAAPSITSYYGAHLAEPDEYDVWGTSQNPSVAPPTRLNWHLIAMCSTIIALAIAAWWLVIAITTAILTSDFLAPLLSTITRTLK